MLDFGEGEPSVPQVGMVSVHEGDVHVFCFFFFFFTDPAFTRLALLPYKRERLRSSSSLCFAVLVVLLVSSSEFIILVCSYYYIIDRSPSPVI